jgi:hypothetical protein
MHNIVTEGKKDSTRQEQRMWEGELGCDVGKIPNIFISDDCYCGKY